MIIHGGYCLASVVISKDNFVHNLEIFGRWILVSGTKRYAIDIGIVAADNITIIQADRFHLLTILEYLIVTWIIKFILAFGSLEG